MTGSATKLKFMSGSFDNDKRADAEQFLRVHHGVQMCWDWEKETAMKVGVRLFHRSVRSEAIAETHVSTYTHTQL